MRFTLILLSLLLLSGCVPPSQNQLRMEMDLEEMKRRLAHLEVQKVEKSQSQIAGGDTQQRLVAELLAGVDNMRVEFQSVNGRIDDLGRDNREMSAELQLVRDDTGLQLTSVANRIAVLEQQVSGLELTRDSPQLPVQQPEPELTAEQLYQKALDLIRNQKEFAAGRTLLDSFVNKYPDHDLYVNALFWSGEAFYGEKKYELAILQFQDVISKHSTHSKAAAAMLKQALAFNALGDSENARTTMQKLIEGYPNSAQVAAATAYLENTEQ